MPKSTKKKKDKAADFSKAKLKLGKGKQVASNAVDTTFKARSITLPSQSLAQASDDSAPTTRRKLRFDDLLTHLKHYNPGTRKDALFGLKELFEEFPDLIVPSLTPFFNGCVRVIGDEDAGARKALLTVLGWLFPRVSTEDLLPHASNLLLFTTSAQTHIFPEIRIDAIRMLDLLLEYMPTTVIDGWERPSGTHGRRVLEGYLGILNAGTAFGESGDTGPVQATSTASVVLSPASKLLVLKSLSLFLSTAFRPPYSAKPPNKSSLQQPTPSWFFASSFQSRAAYHSFNRLMESNRWRHNREPLQDARQWSETVGPESFVENFVNSSTWSFDGVESDLTLQDLTDLHDTMNDTETGVGTTTEMSYIAQLARALQPTLISTFLDYAPSVFSPNAVPPETDLQLVLVSVQITRVIYGRISSSDLGIIQEGNSVLDCISSLLGHMSIYFPFTLHWPQNVKRDIKTEDAFQSLNLAFCELSSLFMLERSGYAKLRREEVASAAGRRSASVAQNTKFLHVDRVRRYVLALLRGETSVTTQPTLSRVISPAAYTALLPALWALLSTIEPGNPDVDGEVFSILLDHSMKTSSHSALKKHTIDFLGRVILLRTSVEPHRLPQVLCKLECQKKMQEWLLHLPKVLWELGANDSSATESILRLLLRLSQRHSDLLDHVLLPSIRSRLIPYFMIRHPVRGSLPGPYTKLPPTLRLLALDVVYATMELSRTDEVHNAVLEVVTGKERSYWTSLLALSCRS